MLPIARIKSRVIIAALAATSLLAVTACSVGPIKFLGGENPTTLSQAAGRAGESFYDERCGNLEGVATAVRQASRARLVTATPSSLKCGILEEDAEDVMQAMVSAKVNATWEIPARPFTARAAAALSSSSSVYAKVNPHTDIHHGGTDNFGGSNWSIVDMQTQFSLLVQANPGASVDVITQSLRDYYLSKGQPNDASPLSQPDLLAAADAANVDACRILQAADTGLPVSESLGPTYVPLFAWLGRVDGPTTVMGACSATLRSGEEVSLAIGRGPTKSVEEVRAESDAELKIGNRTVYSYTDAGRRVLVFQVENLRVNLLPATAETTALMEQVLEKVPGT